ncbi:MAG: AAA family ATPase [Candidatus Aenigmarchaeota archaeon]|nr:AAA family ATPase [Candidatus Aenigmarchaeota archaeon]
MGAGKTSTAQHLASLLCDCGMNVGVIRVFDDIYLPMLKIRELPLTREGLNQLIRALYAERGRGVISQLIAEIIVKEGNSERVYIVDSCRSPSGLRKIREMMPNTIAVGIAAPTDVRLKRLITRRRNIESEYDKDQLLKLMADEEQIYHLSEAMQLMDFAIDNSGTDNSLRQQVINILDRIRALFGSKTKNGAVDV